MKQAYNEACLTIRYIIIIMSRANVWIVETTFDKNALCNHILYSDTINIDTKIRKAIADSFDKEYQICQREEGGDFDCLLYTIEDIYWEIEHQVLLSVGKKTITYNQVHQLAFDHLQPDQFEIILWTYGLGEARGNQCGVSNLLKQFPEQDIYSIIDIYFAFGEILYTSLRS
mgnify:CR=1 FL=1